LNLLIAAAIAAAAPASGSACPSVVTPQALVCRALEARDSGSMAAAAAAFEEAARASPDKEASTARLWAAAGNMWIVAGQPAKAAADLDKALSLPGLDGQQRGEALLDRARVAEAQNDLVTARVRLDQAAPTVGQDPFYWYFAASLAMREGNKAAAQSAIGKALALAPADPAILFEAGHVAHLAGDEAGARDYWQRALARDPAGPIGKAAKSALAMLTVPLTVKN
jgi:tetratricopeptide (TPR) repeat protein